MPWPNTRRNALLPNAWDASWTARRSRRVVLNQKPSAWENTGETPPIGLRAPFGDGDSGWQNPTTTHSVPLNEQTGAVTAVLTQNNKRNLLVIQNNSSATLPDIAPTFYIGFGQLAQIGQGLGLAPGVGIVLDIVCPRDAIYMVIGPAVNNNGTVVVQGVAVEGGLVAGS